MKFVASCSFEHPGSSCMATDHLPSCSSWTACVHDWNFIVDWFIASRILLTVCPTSFFFSCHYTPASYHTYHKQSNAWNGTERPHATRRHLICWSVVGSDLFARSIPWNKSVSWLWERTRHGNVRKLCKLCVCKLCTTKTARDSTAEPVMWACDVSLWLRFHPLFILPRFILLITRHDMWPVRSVEWMTHQSSHYETVLWLSFADGRFDWGLRLEDLIECNESRHVSAPSLSLSLSISLLLWYFALIKLSSFPLPFFFVFPDPTKETSDIWDEESNIPPVEDFINHQTWIDLVYFNSTYWNLHLLL